MKIKVLSLFDGMSCGQIALNKIGFTVDTYYASEIDTHAIKVTQANYPATIQLGDVTRWKEWDNIDWSSIDLVTGGFPCQAWSVAGKQLGDRDSRGMLFWTMLDVIKKVLSSNPNAKYLIENVKMKKEFEEYITFHTEQSLGKVEKHLINSCLVSAQNRQRYYWTNIQGITQPEDKKIYLKDIIQIQQQLEIKENPEKSNTLSTVKKDNVFVDINKPIQVNPDKSCKNTQPHIQDRVYSEFGKSPCLTKEFANRMKVEQNLKWRKLTPLECERLQTVPDNYTRHVSNTQRYKMLGNGWTVDVIAHIFSFLKNA